MPLLTPEQFTANYDLPIGNLVENRGGSFNASYLSWAHAINLMKQRHPNLAVQTNHKKHGDQAYVLASIVCMDTQITTPPIYFPVMDNRFEPIDNPSVTDINYACQRATAKVIAVHTGIGLKLYAGEDIPTDGQIASTPNNITQRPLTDAEAREEMPVPDQPDHWRNAVVPIGKHKGKFLGNLNPKSRNWFLTSFEANENYQDSVDFRKACDACQAEENTYNEPSPVSDDLEEDVPF